MKQQRLINAEELLFEAKLMRNVCLCQCAANLHLTFKPETLQIAGEKIPNRPL